MQAVEYLAEKDALNSLASIVLTTNINEAAEKAFAYLENKAPLEGLSQDDQHPLCKNDAIVITHDQKELLRKEALALSYLQSQDARDQLAQVAIFSGCAMSQRAFEYLKSNNAVPQIKSIVEHGAIERVQMQAEQFLQSKVSLSDEL